MPKRARETKTVPAPAALSMPDSARTAVSFLFLAVAIIVVFYPLMQYFFAQDDFILISRSAFQTKGSIIETVQSHPGQFRPLSKVLYFFLMYRLFHLNPIPYHVVSMLLYIINAMLFFLLMRSFRLSFAGALVTAALFALSTSFINVVAWISCIQQLLSMCFGLLTLLFGLRGIDRRSTGLSLLATACYGISLLSLEQTAALPLVLALYAYLHSKLQDTGQRLRHAVSATLMPLAVMAAYAVFMLLWRTLPKEGPYTFHWGRNLFDNFLVYSDWGYAFSVQLPLLIDNLKTGLSSSHLLLLALVLYNLARGRRKIVIIGGAYYLLTLLPVLPLESHTFFIHTYIPSFGLLVLLGWLLDDLYRFFAGRDRTLAAYYTCAFLVLIPAAAFVQTRRNIDTPIHKSYPLPRDFVLRKAILAQNAYQDIMARKAALPPGGKFFMVFVDKQSWQSDNVVGALGGGTAIKLFFDDPTLQVFTCYKGDTLQAFTPQDSQILFCDILGRFFTDKEVTKAGSAIGQIEP
jgi:hypothetical protein